MYKGINCENLVQISLELRLAVKDVFHLFFNLVFLEILQTGKKRKKSGLLTHASHASYCGLVNFVNKKTYENQLVKCVEVMSTMVRVVGSSNRECKVKCYLPIQISTID